MVLAFLTAVGFGIKALVSTPTPEEGACYQHKTEYQTVAKVDSTIDHGYDVEVKYVIETSFDSWNPKPYRQERSRFKGEFADLYEKLPSCDRFYYRAEKRYSSELEDEIAELKAKKHK